MEALLQLTLVNYSIRMLVLHISNYYNHQDSTHHLLITEIFFTTGFLPAQGSR